MPFNGYIDPSRPDPHGWDDATVVIYGYTPSIALSALGIATFALALLAHLYRAVRLRHALLASPLVVAGCMELLGYIFRALSSTRDPYRIGWFVAQYFLIVTAPILITAVMYVCLNKIMAMVERSRVPRPTGLGFLTPRRILWVFIVADVVTTIVQVAGAALIGVKTSRHQDPAAANNIVLTGIAVQSLSFILYLAILTRVGAAAYRYRASLPNRLTVFVSMLWIASVLVLVRLIFRLAETSVGVFGYLMVHEAFFGTLEFLPILGAMTILAVWHPAKALKEERVEHEAVEFDGVVVKGARY